MGADRQGWFADRDVEAPDIRSPWQPYLQLDGLCLPLNVWFASEYECLGFIRSHVIGHTILE